VTIRSEENFPSVEPIDTGPVAISTMVESRTCKTHGDYAAKLFRFRDDGLWVGGHCPQCLDEQDKADRLRAACAEDRARLQKIERLSEWAKIPRRFQGKTLDSYQTSDAGEDKAKKIAIWYCETWSERLASGTSLIFCGEPGTGKTHLACAIGQRLLATGTSVLFTTAADCMRQIKSTYNRDSVMTETAAISMYTSPDLLILDEVHVQTGSDHEIRLMFELVNRRYERILPTIIISNLEAVALKQFLGDRIVDRLREGRGQLIQFTWSSRRA